MSYEQKYLKYKQKYLELKNNLNSIETTNNSVTETKNTPTQYQLSDTPVNEMNGGDFYSFLGKYNNMEDEISNRVNVLNTQQVQPKQPENMVLTETPQAQDGGYQLNTAPFKPPVEQTPPVVKPDGGIVNVEPTIKPSIADIAVSDSPQPLNQSDLGDKSTPVETNSKNLVESPQLSDVENTTDIENIFKQLGGKRKSKKDIDDSSDIFGSSDSISLDDSNSSSDYSATPPVPSDSNPFE
jgi:hypothetical protein